jgi:hypothetical protein
MSLTDEQMWSLWNAQGSDAMDQKEAIEFARAIESATAAPLLERIAELEQQLEAARKDAERAEVLLKALVTQIDRCNPVDDHGHDMKMNAAYLAAKELL